MNGATAISSLAYAYHDGNNLVWGDGLNLTGITDNVTPANSVSLWYNPAGRMTYASSSYGLITHYYNGVGDRAGTSTTLNGVTSNQTQYYSNSYTRSSVAPIPIWFNPPKAKPVT